MFNGFYGHRIIIGHFPYHGFMLVPLITFLILRKDQNILSRGVSIGLIGLGFAYMVHTPMLQILPATILAITPLIFLHAIKFKSTLSSWLNLLLGGLVGAALSASKLVAMTSLMHQFPRTYYPLPGVANILEYASILLQVLFGTVPKDIEQHVTNTLFAISQHEWEFGMTPIPLIFFLWGLYQLVKAIASKRGVAVSFILKRTRLIFVILLTLNIILPVAINWYEPHWNALLKALPYLSSSSNLVRWLIIEIPIIAAITALLLDGIHIKGLRDTYARNILAGLSILGVVAFNLTIDRSYYRQTYDLKTIASAWGLAHAYQKSQPIEWIILQNDVLGNGANDAMATGASTINCYEPTMGYRLEKFPVGALHPGRVFEADGHINIKNPACYLFPNENQCKPGDHFTPDQKTDAEAFVQYKPYPIKFSSAQHIANTISLIAGLIMLAIFLFRGIAAFLKHLK